jgi:hypothetical protein
MPFAVTLPQSHPDSPPLYAIRDRDGYIYWTPDKRRVVAMTDTEAEALLSEVNEVVESAASVTGFVPPEIKA